MLHGVGRFWFGKVGVMGTPLDFGIDFGKAANWKGIQVLRKEDRMEPRKEEGLVTFA